MGTRHWDRLRGDTGLAMDHLPEPSANEPEDQATTATSTPTFATVPSNTVSGGSVVPLLPTSSISLLKKSAGADDAEDASTSTPAIYHSPDFPTVGSSSPPRKGSHSVAPTTAVPSSEETPIWLTIAATLRAAEGPQAGAGATAGGGGGKKKGVTRDRLLRNLLQ